MSDRFVQPLDQVTVVEEQQPNRFVQPLDCVVTTDLRAAGDLPGHPFRGNQWTTVSGEPRIFNTLEDIEKIKGWPGDPVRYQWKGKAGSLVTGVPIDHGALPETLYHVTTNAPAVEASGMLLGQNKDGGLGGGQADGVSFTTDLTSARVIQRELTRSVRIARGDDTIEAIKAYAREDEIEGGLPAGALNRAVADAQRAWDGNIDSSYNGKATYDTDEKKQSLVKDAFNSYLWARDTDAKGVAVLKNPILFGDQKQLRLIDPKGIKTLHVPRLNVPRRALVTTGSDAFLHEARVYSDVPTRGTRALAARPGEGPLHRAADAHRAKLSVAVRYAFAMGRRNLRTELLKLKKEHD